MPTSFLFLQHMMSKSSHAGPDAYCSPQGQQAAHSQARHHIQVLPAAARGTAIDGLSITEWSPSSWSHCSLPTQNKNLSPI